MNNLEALEYQLRVYQVDEETIHNIIQGVDKIHLNTLTNNELTIFAIRLYDSYISELKYHNNVQILMEILEKEYPNTLNSDDINNVISNVDINYLTSLDDEEIMNLARSIYDDYDENRFIDIDYYR
jgi:hypothetical protein